MPDSPSTLLLLVRLAGSLALVLSLVGALTWILRRKGMLNGAGSRAGRRIEVLERKGLGKRSSLVVARAGGAVVLLGVTDQKITLLSDSPAIAQSSVTDVDEHPQECPTQASVIDIGSRRTGTQVGADSVPADEPRMSFLEALREMTVRQI